MLDFYDKIFLLTERFVMTTAYIVVTLVLFCLNLFSNLIVLSNGRGDRFPAVALVATILSIFFILWASILLFS